jgi:PAS domain S-box-containing protein
VKRSEEKSKQINNLHKRAEEILDRDPETLQSLPPKDVQKLIHELNIHQIELEMQNEELRRAQVEIEESRNRYSDLYDFSPIGYFNFDKTGLIMEVNLTGGDLLGIERGKLIKRNFSRFIAKKFQNAFYSHRQSVFKTKTKQACELKLVKKDGSEFYARLESIPVQNDEGEISSLRTAITDITEQKQAAEKIEEKTNLSRILLENIPSVALLIRPETRVIVHANKHAEEVGAVPGKQCFVTWGKRNEPCPWCLAPELWATGETKRIEVEVSGTIWDTYWVPITEDLYLHYAFDITKRTKLVRHQLREYLIVSGSFQRKLEQIVERTVDIFQADFCRIWIIKPGDKCDIDCIHNDTSDEQHKCLSHDHCLHLVASSERYSHINGKMHQRVPFGCYKIGLIAAVQDRKFLTNDVIHDPRIHDRNWAKELGLVSFAGYRLLSSSGKPVGVLALFSKQPITDEDDALLEGLADNAAQVIIAGQAEEALKNKNREIENLNTNLEERVQKELEKSRQKDFIMMHQSRLAAMGEMIGNIAHQWKQPLNALNILLYNIKESLNDEEIDKELLDKLSEKGNELVMNMATTVDDFRHFFKPNKRKEKFCINETINKSLALVESSFKHNNISAILNQKEKITILGFSNEYSQVILNILNNAKDAILSKNLNGKIEIDIYCEDGAAVTRISDNAGGIPENLLNHIFDPYFTTKEERRGTGIGLYMSKVIIENHMNGRLTVQNIDGGAEFKITIPVTTAS